MSTVYTYWRKPPIVGVFTAARTPAELPRYFIQADGDSCSARVEMSRERAIALRRELSRLLRDNKP